MDIGEPMVTFLMMCLITFGLIGYGLWAQGRRSATSAQEARLVGPGVAATIGAVLCVIFGALALISLLTFFRMDTPMGNGMKTASIIILVVSVVIFRRLATFLRNN